MPAGTEMSAEINKVFLKETEKVKYRPGSIVKQMRAEGFVRFGMKQHTDLWKNGDAKNPKYQFGVQVEGTWFWYETWVAEVRKYCQANEMLFKPVSPSAAAAMEGVARR